jgi:hypothetical protein
MTRLTRLFVLAGALLAASPDVSPLVTPAQAASQENDGPQLRRAGRRGRAPRRAPARRRGPLRRALGRILGR